MLHLSFHPFPSLRPFCSLGVDSPVGSGLLSRQWVHIITVIPLLWCGAIICAIAIAAVVIAVIAILLSVSRKVRALSHCRLEDVLEWRQRRASSIVIFNKQQRFPMWFLLMCFLCLHSAALSFDAISSSDGICSWFWWRTLHVRKFSWEEGASLQESVRKFWYAHVSLRTRTSVMRFFFWLRDIFISNLAKKRCLQAKLYQKRGKKIRWR